MGVKELTWSVEVGLSFMPEGPRLQHHAASIVGGVVGFAAWGIPRAEKQPPTLVQGAWSPHGARASHCHLAQALAAAGRSDAQWTGTVHQPMTGSGTSVEMRARVEGEWRCPVQSNGAPT